MTTRAVAAVDLGATSGRVMLARFTGTGRVALEEVARFPNGGIRLASGLHWDLTALYGHAVTGLAAAVREEPALASIGIDSWAVDYALLRGNRLLGEPFHYRDERTAAGVDAVHAQVPFPELYARTGLQFLPFTTVYQLAAERDTGLLGLADTVLLVPDAIAYLLTGACVAERTNASTTGLVGVRSGTWDDQLIARLDLPAAVLPSLVSPGDRIGTVRTALTAEWGRTTPLDVVAVGSHDTASAVVAVPMSDPSTAAYISCGTWGLVGLELDEPVTTDAARAANFTNEGGVDGRIRFLHNVMGLWLLSESVRQWERESGQRIDLPTLLADASELTEIPPVFDANDPGFLAPGDMPARIAGWYRAHGLPAPASRAAFARAIVESLAEAFARAVDTAASLADRDIRTIHIVGGGSLNTLLCRRTAERSGREVLAGPVEATALGNVLVQARSHGWFGTDATLEDLREVVSAAATPRRFAP